MPFWPVGGSSWGGERTPSGRSVSPGCVWSIRGSWPLYPASRLSHSSHPSAVSCDAAGGVVAEARMRRQGPSA